MRPSLPAAENLHSCGQAAARALARCVPKGDIRNPTIRCLVEAKRHILLP
jgi:hypothetical protein